MTYYFAAWRTRAAAEVLLLGTLCTWMVPRNASRVHTHPRNAMQLLMHATVHRMSCHGCTPAMHATALFCNFGGRGVWWCMKALTQFRVHRCRTPGVGVLERASCKLQQCDVLTMCCIHIYYICKFSGGLPAPHTSKQLREPSAMQPCLHSGEGFAAYALHALLRCCPALGRVHNGPTLHRER